MEFLGRTELLYGADYCDKIKNKKVAVFGLGGVGGYVVEMLCRAGVSNFLICDNDIVSVSNINRQIIANVNTVGQKKTDVFLERIHSVNPEAQVRVLHEFVTPENVGAFIDNSFDCVCVAIDTVTSKIGIIMECEKCSVPVISSMGAGNRLDPLMVRIGDIYETKNDPLARVMRRELKKRGVDKLKCAYSLELPLKPLTHQGLDAELKNGRPAPGSTAFVPSAFGIAIAAHIMNILIFK